MKTLPFPVAAVAATILAAVTAPAEPSRCTLGEAKFMSWAQRDRTWTLKAGLLHLDAKPDAATAFGFNLKNDARFIAAFPGGPRYRIAFKYRSTARATLKLSAKPMDTFDPRLWSQSKDIPPSAEWAGFAWEPMATQIDCLDSTGLRLSCAAGEGFIEVKELSITDVPPEDKSGKPLLVNGSRVEEVCLYASDTPRHRLNDLRAALMFRYALRTVGGEWLPIREVENAGEVGENAVLVGRLAVDAGVVDAAEQAKVEGLTGGWATAARGGRLGLAGAVPGGVQRGAWRALERLGIVYLGSDVFKPFAGDAFETCDFAETVLPATAFPTASGNGRCGYNAELRGMVSRDCLVGAHAIGSVPERDVLYEDSLGCIVPVSEFRETHPEYFALQADGTRLTDNAHAGVLTHFCWTAPGLAELVAERYREMMRALPEQPVWILAPGDGGGRNCKCDSCKALGSDSDGLVRLANRVAELTAREFPDNVIWIYSYVDTPEPPKNPVRAHPNLNVGYAVYPERYWPSCMVIPHPANERGEMALEAWRRECCPNLSLIGYFFQCGQWMNCWPAFDADVWLTRDFARHRSFLTWCFGMTPAHAGYINEAGSFVDLILYVLARIEVNPELDERKLADEFIGWFYGAAAGPMREFFRLAMEEPKRRDWVQFPEQRRSGLISKEFADRAFPLLDEAVRLADGDEALARRIRKQAIPYYWTYLDGVNRGHGNVSSAEVEVWAHRVARFAALCRANGTFYMGKVSPRQWFHDKMMLDISATDSVYENWTKAPEIQAVLNDPVGTLAGNVPNLQRETEDGIEIPVGGMVGGERERKCFWRNKEGYDLRILRRESSGYGIAITHLDIEEAPPSGATLYLKGIDNDKEGVAQIMVKVNGEAIYEGPVGWRKDKHGEWALELPGGLLKAGENEIIVMNTTPDTEVDGECGDLFRAKRDYFWGWIMLDGIRVAFR
ncbi:MAG: DUF4838 domain-containing protein [Kiritimatiellae bacterium]|nr:DUF4838 domain-containing protein [Kiritimatiellia bacterium]